MPVTAPYGSWKSPITSDLIVGNMIDLAEISLDGENIYWLEMRPEEQGRFSVVKRSPDGQTADLLPAPWNMRTRVHEYGGKSYLVYDDVLYFSNFTDQRLYRLRWGGQPEPLTPPPGPSGQTFRYADFVMDARHQRLIGVREEHSASNGSVVNTLVGVDLDRSTPSEQGSSGQALQLRSVQAPSEQGSSGQALQLRSGQAPSEQGSSGQALQLRSGQALQLRSGQVLVSGKDFYSNPRISPDGARLCWLEWSHPNMPWDGCELWMAGIASDGSLEDALRIAGGSDESIFQPSWSPDGVLYFISDRSGWWNLYRWQNGQVEALHPVEADLGEPQWVFGQSTYAFESPERLVCIYPHAGRSTLAVLDTRSLDFQPLQLPYTQQEYISASPGRVLFIGGSPLLHLSLVQLDLQSGQTTLIKQSTSLALDPGYLSIPEQIEFPTGNGLSAYAYYYAPRNKDFTASDGELPPLIVVSHGGPTSSISTVFNLGKQYWTSRGFGVVDVDYGGSTGYGRAYRERLKGQFGILDVDDCANAAGYLARQGWVDGQRLAIRGGSAGGYTTLAALTFRKVFKAGASLYGISDLETMALDTHKFEAHYLDSLIGPYPARRDVYIARSPIHFTDRLDCALILFQGSEDKVVPPEQSRQMFAAVRLKGLPVAYLEFPGEGHGFRQAGHIKQALDAELYFYGKVFGFEPAGPLEAIPIENL